MDKQMSWGHIAMLCFLMLVAFFLLQGMISRRSAALETRETQLQVQLSEVEDATAKLQSEVKQIGSSSYIENKARAEYNFMKSGEMRFSFTNPEALYSMSESEKAIYAEEMGTDNQ